MRFAAVVTFEFEARQPETERVVVEAGSAATASARALRAAQGKLKPRSWASVVVLLTKEGVADSGPLKDSVPEG